MLSACVSQSRIFTGHRISGAYGHSEIDKHVDGSLFGVTRT
jgi:hypothetical protein